MVKIAILDLCIDLSIVYSDNSETIENRSVHAWRGLASIELSFHPCNILRDSRRGVSRWAAVRENGDFLHLQFE